MGTRKSGWRTRAEAERELLAAAEEAQDLLKELGYHVLAERLHYARMAFREVTGQ